MEIWSIFVAFIEYLPEFYNFLLMVIVSRMICIIYFFFQGVFAFRRGTKRNSTNQDAKKKKSRKKRSKPENTADDVPEFFGKSANAKFRFDLYNQYF